MDLAKFNVDYLLVNTTNQFLLEYAPIEENACHKLTGFTGDTGDSLLTADGEIFLFVDGRYHTQADNEVDHNKVQVVKLAIGQRQDDEIIARIKPHTTLGIDSRKVSQARYEYFKTLLKEIHSEVKLLDIKSEIKSKAGDAVEIPTELTGASFEEKVAKIHKPALFTNSEEISYLCNLRDFSQNFAVKIDGKLFVGNDKSVLFSPNPDKIKTDKFEVRPLADFDEFIKGINEEIIVDKSTINAHDYALVNNPKAENSEVKQMKAVKNDAEIKHLKHCFEMTDKALLATRDYIYNNDNISELDIDNELTKNFMKFGAKSLSFKSIVARNQNAALAHYMKSSKDEIVKDGDLVLIDCGAYYEGGLATDCTRVFVKGKPSELQRKVYTTVLKMFLNAYNYKMVEGFTQGFEIDNLARVIAVQNEIKGFEFSHGLGHGIGVCVHEAPPNLSKNNIARTPIKNHMCFTIEPGLYNDEYFGVRLENSCYLEDEAIKSFSDMCYEEKLIDYSLLNEDEKDMLKEFKVK